MPTSTSPSDSVSRLEGVYGNPNFLGYALALALPATAAAIVRAPGWRRWAAIAVTALLGGLLFATYSRGSLLAAAAGAVVAAPSRYLAGHRDRWSSPSASACPCSQPAFLVSPFYKSKRLEADFGATNVQNASGIDHSGWSTLAVGPVRHRERGCPTRRDRQTWSSRPSRQVKAPPTPWAGRSRRRAVRPGRSRSWPWAPPTPVSVGWAVADDRGTTLDRGLVRAGSRARHGNGAIHLTPRPALRDLRVDRDTRRVSHEPCPA